MAEYLDFISEDDDAYDFSGEVLPCEFCSELFPLDVLIIHQTRCFYDCFEDQGKNDKNTESEVSNKHDIASKNEIMTSSISTKQESENLIVFNQSTPIDRISKIVEENFQKSESSFRKPMLSIKDTSNKQEEKPKFELTNLNLNQEILSVATLNNCSKIVEPDSEISKVDFSECDLSDDNEEDGEKETVEKLWLQASVVLKKRLAASKRANDSMKNHSHSGLPVRNQNRFENQRQRQYN